MIAAARQDSAALRGALRTDEPMSRHTVWGIGGPARRFYRPADSADLATFVRANAGADLFWLGLGSNLLIRDGGLDATVIHLPSAAERLQLAGATTITASAGVPCPKVARYCVQHGLTGIEFFAGIPGTVGGALAMNAGAFGGETWDVVARVRTIDAGGTIRERGADEYRAAYRHVQGPPGEWFLAADFQLGQATGEDGAAAVKALLAKRAASQPMGQRSCGLVFRNPQGDFAARLIEACGLKGERRGGAVVSEKHANFIINTGQASAADVEGLIEFIRARVRDVTGVDLVPEVLIVGKPAGDGR